MRITLTRWTRYAIATLAIFGGPPSFGVAMADSAYIGQIPPGTAPSLTYETTIENALSNLSSQIAGTIPNLENALPHTKGGNLATTLTIGYYNQVLQVQTGSNDESNVAILGGANDGVAVLQAGSNLHSNIGLIGLQNEDIGVFQPNGAAPVDLLAARLPNGRLLIIR